MSEKKIILGIWDGHDSGAAFLEGSKILFAMNEERLTRRKLEICFPSQSIRAGLKKLKINPESITHIAVSTYDFAKTLSRIFPVIKENYYQIRRRKKKPGILNNIKKLIKYKITEIGSNFILKWIGKIVLTKELRKIGFKKFNIFFINHHLAHITSAGFCSSFEKTILLSLDGIGDGLSGMIGILNKSKIQILSKISGKNSLGIFFEHVTNLMNMRELEDEGKVMALANYSYPIEDEKNPLLKFFKVDGLNIKAKYSSLKMYKELKKILWSYPSEQFAYMAQRILEIKISELVKNIINETKIKNIAYSGGVASNIKVNMVLKNLKEVDDIFIFPHMGDGGLALGAAMALNYKINKVYSYELKDVYLGLSFSNKEIMNIILKNKLKFKKCENIPGTVAELLCSNNIILWYQGKMEIGPRALGGRSILALPNSFKIKDQLNLFVKKRVWYQPFCPSMLSEDACKLLEDYNDKPNYFMTMGYKIKDNSFELLKGVINVDNTCRPQIVNDTNSKYYKLLKYVKKKTNVGVVLNTSFNIHGEPIVCSPEDAISTFLRTEIKYLAIGDYLLWK